MASGGSPTRDGHSSGTPVARRFEQPTRTAGFGHQSWSAIAACATPRSTPPLFGLAPGGVCRAACVAASAVRSYRTVSPLPRHPLPISPGLWGRVRGRGARRSVLCGTVPRVTPAGRYPAPHVHGARTFLPSGLSASAGVAVRPTDRLGMGCAEGHVKARCRGVSSGRFRRPTPLIDGVLKLLYKLIPPNDRQPTGSNEPYRKSNTYNHGTNTCRQGCGIAS